MRTCSTADLALTVGADQPKYHVGDQPGITLDLVNTSATTCTGDFGPANQDAKVYARSNRLWSSNDCHPSDDHIVVTLRPGEHFRYTIKWAGYTSLPGCAPSHILVGAGIYQAYGAVDGLRGAVRLEIWPAETAAQAG